MLHEVFVERTQAIAKELGIELPTSYYRYAPQNAGNVKRT